MKLSTMLAFAFALCAGSHVNAGCTETSSELQIEHYSASPYVSARIVVGEDCEARTVISIDGPLEQSTFSALSAAQMESMGAGIFGRDMVLILNSPGGDLDGAYLSALGLGTLTTYIPDGAQCASACILLFAAGNDRVIASDGKLGVHSAYYSSNSRQALAGNVKVAKFLARKGVDYNSVMELMNTTPGSEMVWLNAREAKRLGFATRIVR